MDLKKLINRGIELGLAEIEVYSSESINKSIKVENGKLDSLNTKAISGYSIRGKYNGKMGYVYYENISEDMFDEIVNKIILNASMITSTEEEILFDGAAEYQSVVHEDTNAADYTNLDKINLLVELEGKLKATDPRIVKVAHNSYMENISKTRIVNSKGLDLTRELGYLGAVCGVLAFENGQSTVGYAQSIAKDFNKLDKELLVKESTDTALNALNAGSAKTGFYETVLNRDCMSQLLSAFTGIFSSEAALKKMTKLIGKEGEKIFGDNIVITEDPFHPNAIAKINFDDEGYPTKTKNIVENGIFKTFLYNLKTAQVFGKTSTGNGFKAGVESPVRVSTTTLYLQPGTKSEEELIASIEDGIYITDISGLHAGLDIISGDFNVQSSGRLIKNGKLADPVTLFVVSGNYYDMMNNVVEIANNLEDTLTGTHAPSVKIAKLAISGK